MATMLDGGWQHVFYRGTDNNVHHAWRDPDTNAPGTINHDPWTTDGSVAGNMTTLVTG